MVQPFNPSKYLGKRLRENEIGKAYGLSSGKLNPWDLPEFETARQNMLAERDVGLSDLTRRLTRSGVEGPAAALSLEKAGNKYSSSLLDLANKLQGAYTDRGLTLGKQAIEEDYRKWLDTMNMAMWWKKQHDLKKGQGSGIEGIIKALLEGASSMGGGGGDGGSGFTGGGSGVAGVGSSGSFGDWTGGMAFGDGGTIEEPIVGTGLDSGMTYTFGEYGPEEVIPYREVTPGERALMAQQEEPRQSRSGLRLPRIYGNSAPSEGYKNGYGIGKGISGIAKLIASYYMSSPGMAKSGGQDITKGISSFLD